MSFSLWLLSPALAQAQAQKTVLDGVYSDVQAGRGEVAYTTLCSGCHGADLNGISAPALTGTRFVERWREGMLDVFYDYIKERMPPAGKGGYAGPIPDKDKLDILTHILKMNGYRIGAADLSSDLLSSVMFVGKNGPQPVPDGALIISVGCLSQPREGVWVLSSATDPVRTRTSATSTAAELKTSSQKSLGVLSFRLSDLEAVSDFNPTAHAGHKMQAKGFLIRQATAERISLSSMEMLDSSCLP